MGSKKLFETEKLIQEISQSIQHILWKNFAHISTEEKEEIAQEVQYKIWKSLSSGKQIDNLKSYLWKVVYTTALDIITEKISYYRLNNNVELNVEDLHKNMNVSSSETLLEKKELELLLMKGINSLSQNRRIVIKLSLTGMNISEISEFLGWSTSKVNHLYYRGLEDLKRRVKDIQKRK